MTVRKRQRRFKRTYPSIRSNEWIAPVMRGYRMACGDCGVVHRIDFRVIWSIDRGETVQLRSNLDKRATAALRRHRRFKTKKTPASV